MIVEGRCRHCGWNFSAHWHDWNPKDGCPKCGLHSIHVETDETEDLKQDACEVQP
jgi:Zn finger protein HypA/HybF involved in hydrogenase expression